ncbi:winged helix-turn-helix transcriptional regulator [Skermania sp. ID1734]|uniref:ArsR/SmtB family transcription factor n=1 Tax=Skermania sp. ID1734 TaxID=2597516 RepID=UPI00117EB51F|nr:metalloregulator ArsR/SmtB family transcription factor [Skermania sp. ID1734]TSE00245.1 winged helix-turn-helix transcriptional regulator [Skermania sp. ID1734]
MATYEAVFDALGHTTRREILELVRRRPSSVQELADQLPISRPAVSQHLKILGDAGIVSASSLGTRRVYSVNKGGFEVLRQWLDIMWRDALDSFVSFADSYPEEGVK